MNNDADGGKGFWRHAAHIGLVYDNAYLPHFPLSPFPHFRISAFPRGFPGTGRHDQNEDGHDRAHRGFHMICCGQALRVISMRVGSPPSAGML